MAFPGPRVHPVESDDMGIRERLEAIKDENVSSFADPEFTPAKPAKVKAERGVSRARG